MIGIVLLNITNDHIFSFAINIGDKVPILFLLDIDIVTLIKTTGDHISGPTCGPHSYI